MAKLYFKYASMNSGKSMDLIRTAYNYEENGYQTLILKPIVDTKSEDKLSSRVGVERKADELILYSESILEKLKGKLNDVSCIFVDEAQFLSISQVDELFLITKAVDIPVICYGLRNNFKMEAFAGSKRLLEIADILEELKTLCSCKNIARYVARKVNNTFVLEGEEIIIDGTVDVKYVPLCGKCYLEKVKKIDLSKIKESLK